MSTESFQKKIEDLSSNINSDEFTGEKIFQPLINRRSSRIRSLSRSSYSFNPASETLSFSEHKNLKESLKKKSEKILKKWKNIVLESNKIRQIKNYFNDKYEQPTWFKFFDKLAFTFGVLNILICQFFLFNLADYFYIWYSFVVPILMISRFYHFKSLNWQYFLIDFCYFTISLTLINIYFLYDNPRLFKVCFIYSTGVLPMAIPVWRNSLIFHDFDKIVSVFIHILPCMLYYTLRWKNISPEIEFGKEFGLPHALEELSQEIPTKSGHVISNLDFYDYIIAIGLYLVWQTTYIVKTEFIDRAHFESNPDLITSLKWLAKDTKNSFARFLLNVLRIIGIFRKDEDFDSTSLKTKMVFVLSQLLFTIVTILPTPLFYYSKTSLLTYTIVIFTISVFNGASFYIEVFSVRYHQQVKELEMVHSIAEEAQKVAIEISKIAEQEEAARILSVAESFKIQNQEIEGVNLFRRKSAIRSITPRDTLSYLAAVSSVEEEEEEVETQNSKLNLINPKTQKDSNNEVETELSSEDNLSPSILHDITQSLEKTSSEAIKRIEKIYSGDYFSSITLSLPIDFEREKIKYISIFSESEEEMLDIDKQGFPVEAIIPQSLLENEDEDDSPELEEIPHSKSNEYDEASLLAVDQ